MHTVDVEHNCHVDLGLSVNLALVNTGVTLLHVLDAQIPVVAVFWMPDAESPITRVGVDAGGQDVEVAFAHPGYLEQKVC